ncbi:type III secretion system chaperone [Rubinisphaera sp. JC750]|uniref:type III secretion system chaperone n=1 Tax=Rubinisphaera sp. JC750 TaxID=2898658 RepID=UPI001F2B9FC8|nr:type III secretion system chaperone [Rubinisphaera sp. JC750]
MSFKLFNQTPSTRSLLRIACAAALCTAANASAHAQGFPAYQPEPADVNMQLEEEPAKTAAKPAARFPSAEPETPTQSGFPAAEKPTNRFPVEAASFPQEKEENEPAEQAPVGKSLTLEQLNGLLSEMDLETSRFERRHDFLYHADLEDQELELFFSVYLNETEDELRVRAWLDPLPENVISEEPLLKLLGRNIQLPPGMHYGYSSETRRFLLEASLTNRGIQAERLTNVFNNVAGEVAASWSLWSTSEWNNGAKRVATQPELDSRATQIPGDAFEMPIRR